MYLTTDEREAAREHAEDDSRRGYCVRCRSWVAAHVRDESFAYSYGSINAVHRQESIECPECEGALLNDEPIDDPTEGDCDESDD